MATRRVIHDGRHNGKKHYIEVRSPAGQSGIGLEDNEFRAACNPGMDYWRYVVLACAMSAPQLFRLRDPCAGLVAREATRMRISVADVLGGAEIDA